MHTAWYVSDAYRRRCVVQVIVSGKGSSGTMDGARHIALVYANFNNNGNNNNNGGDGNGQAQTHGFGPNGEAINVTVPAFGTEIAAGGAAFTLQVCGASGRHGCVSS